MNGPSPFLGSVEVELPTGTLELRVTGSEFPPDSLLGFAARDNAKRGFLFLSKVLGKHWPVTPQRMAEIHESLAAGVPELPGPVVFISMAETGIGLGQGMFEAWQRAHPDQPALFMHTTRYRVGNEPLIEFEEAHSHAPRQFLHWPADPAQRELFAGMRSLVLVDDEASTGNTFVNLLNACRQVQPDIGHLHLAVITNFMGEQGVEALAQRCALPMTLGACMHGSYRFTAGTMESGAAPAQRFDAHAERGASDQFGRRGRTTALRLPQAVVSGLAADIGAGHKVLVLGTGEFMHAAYALGAGLVRDGVEVLVQSTTRSPIRRWGAVAHTLAFADNYGEGIPNFLYNVAPGQYDHVFICHETPPNAALFELAALLKARLFHFKSEALIEEIPVC
ncbi:phosphoribosyltransferase family protein [Oxalobacteraceae bacterium OTU3CAMAD1]|nr:phosphoribosyltransferase family protein [Oxalobacteraceae bacterium OTU3CAMAD1]